MNFCSSHPTRSLLLALAAIAALTLAACGGDDGPSSGDLGPDPASVTPTAALVYGDAVVQPEGEQRDALNASVGSLVGEDDPIAALEAMLDSELQAEGYSYSEDIEPWLGAQAGFFLTAVSEDSGDGAAVLAATDTGAAQEAIDKFVEASGESYTEEEYEGSSYKLDDNDGAVGLVGDFVVAGTEAGLQAAVDASSGDSLADNSDASAALDQVPDGSLFEVYANTGSLIDAIVASDGVTEEQLAPFKDQLDAYGDQPVVLSGQANEDSLAFDFFGPSGEGDAGETGDALAALPGESWLALAVPVMGEQIGESIDQFFSTIEQGIAAQGAVGGDAIADSSGAPVPVEPSGASIDIQSEIQRATGLDLTKDLNWIGNTSLFVEGSSPLSIGAGVVIETDDEDAASSTIDKLGKAIGSDPSVQVSDTPTGLKIQGVGLPVGAEIAVEDGKVVFAAAGASIDDVLNPSDTLGDSDSFSAAGGALGDDLSPSVYADFETILALVESSGQVGDVPEYQMAKPVLDQLDYLIAGTKVDGDTQTARFVLGLKEASSSSSGAAAITP